MKELKRRFKVINVSVSESKQIVPIEYSLPSEIVSIKGIVVSVREALMTKKEVVEQIGELSLLLNNRKDHLIHIMARYKKPPVFTTAVMELDAKVGEDRNIAGYYIDNGDALDEQNNFLPYTINIHLLCEAK